MSEVKVNKISPRTACGTTTLGDSGDTFNIPCGSKINVASGGNITVASGATITNNGTQTGFGRTGTVDWVTTPKVTGDSPVTAATGSGYFLNTTAGAITINLPAGAGGSIVSIADYAATWQTNNVTVSPNGADKIGSLNEDAMLSTEGQSVTFVYVDSTQGWINTMDSTSNVRGAPPFIVATGGTPCSGAIVCTNYKVHTFTGPGTFCVSNAGSPAGSDTVDYLVVAGGGAGGAAGNNSGGGGAGGYRESSGAASGCYTASPLGSGVTALPVSVTGYPIAVGAAGAATPGTWGGNGGDSIFSSITSTGGGGGGRGDGPTPTRPGRPGGSGGGAAYNVTCFGAGNTPPISPQPQGFPGGPGDGAPVYGSGGGGGSTAAGAVGSGTMAGGAGATTSINATPTTRGGGGGGTNETAGGPGGAGGGGAGSVGNSGTPGQPGTINTGGGGGGGNDTPTGGAGGSGIVIIRYKFQ